MKANCFFIFVVAWLLAFAHITIAQQYYYKSYSVESGLPQSEIWAKSMLQDNYGSIWVGTNGGGLVRFDGDQKTIYTTKNGLISNSIQALYLDSKETLWILTTSGVSRFDGYAFSNYLHSNTILTNALNAARGTSSFLEDRYGNIWLTTPQTLYHFQDSNFVNYSKLDLSLNGAVFNNAFLDQQQQFHLLSQQGKVWYFDGNKFKTRDTTFPLEIQSKGKVVNILSDNQNHLWFIFYDDLNKEGHLVSKQNNKWAIVDLPLNYSPQFVEDILIDHNKYLWVANSQTGVLKHNGQAFQQFNLSNGMPSELATGILEDLEGNIWISSLGGGLIKMPANGFINFTTKDGLPESPIVLSFYEDSKNHIWIGTYNNGFCKYDGTQIIQYPNQPQKTGSIRAFHEEASGELLIATGGKGLFRYDGQRFQSVSTYFGLKPEWGCNTIYEDTDCYVFGTVRKGAFIWDKKKQQVVKQLNRSNGLQHNNVKHIQKDQNGIFWIANSSGISKYNGTHCMPILDSANQSLGACLQTYLDSKNQLWVVSYEKGLYRVNHDGVVFFNLTEWEELPNLFYSITADLTGNLWIGTQRGVEKIVLDEQSNIAKITNYSTLDGLGGTEMNAAAAITDRNGHLWFGHLNGASCYTPEKQQFNQSSTITGINLLFHQTSWADEHYRAYHKGISKWRHLPKNLVLPYDENHLTFKFSVMSYTLPEKIQHQCKLEPINNDWMPPTAKKEVTFSNLMPGTYTFKVRSRYLGNEWGEPTSYSFKIQPPFWKTWWFQCLEGCLFLLLVFSLYSLRLKKIKKKNEKLERLVAARTYEVIQQNNLLQQQKEEITQRNHKLKYQKEEILTQNEELKQQQEEIIAQRDYIEHQHATLQEQNTSMAHSIRYAQTIQAGMLPFKERLKRGLNDYFVIYQPKQVVSGDFYWFEKIGNTRLFAVADCTGHGVPGGFMSVIGIALLNDLVVKNKIYSPAKILTEIDIIIRKILNQDQLDANQDGMDIILCMWEPKDNGKISLTYSGAYSPLYYFNETDLTRLKTCNRSIGGKNYKTDEDFIDYQLDLPQNSRIFLTSDGFIDQNGPNKRKVGTRRFMKLLNQCIDKSMNETEQCLLTYLKEYQQDFEQRDDITIVGITL